MKVNGKIIKRMERYFIWENRNKKYEGEWIIKPNGKGIEYYENGYKKYEGEWIDGKLNGKGIIYSPSENGKKSSEGEFINNKRNGLSIFYDINGIKHFECYFKWGLWHGRFIQYDIDGNIINEGEFRNNKSVKKKHKK